MGRDGCWGRGEHKRIGDRGKNVEEEEFLCHHGIMEDGIHG